MNYTENCALSPLIDTVIFLKKYDIVSWKMLSNIATFKMLNDVNDDSL